MTDPTPHQRLRDNIAAGRTPLDDEMLDTIRANAAVDLDVPPPRVVQLVDEVARLRAALAARTPQPAEPCGCCLGDPNTVCAACGEHSCWAGKIMCEDAPFAGTMTRAPQAAVPNGDNADELLLVRMPGRKSGRITIGHSRLPVETIWQLLAAGDNDDRIINAFPVVDAAALRVLRRLRDNLAEPTPDGDDVPARLEEGADPGPQHPLGTPGAHFQASPQSAGYEGEGIPQPGVPDGPTVWCGDVSGPNGVGGGWVLPPGHPHIDGIGGEWPAVPQPTPESSRSHCTSSTVRHEETS